MLNIEKFRNELSKDLDTLDCQICALRKKDNCKIGDHCDKCRAENIKWLCSEYKEPILDDEEKEYLSAVIKPFRKDVEYIVKLPKFEWIQEAIYIHIGRSWRGNIELPTFKKGAMYKGMKIDKRYTLEELGL